MWQSTRAAGTADRCARGQLRAAIHRGQGLAAAGGVRSLLTSFYHSGGVSATTVWVLVVRMGACGPTIFYACVILACARVHAVAMTGGSLVARCDV